MKKSKPSAGRTKRPQQMTKEELIATLLKKKQCNAKALSIVEGMLEIEVNPQWLLDSLQFISQSHYQDAVEERSIVKLCGYPLCKNPLGNVPKQQFRISTQNNKVYDISDRKNFCSNGCYRSSSFLKDQIMTSPLWLRDIEKVHQYRLLDEGNSSRGGLGDEIDVGPTRVTAEEASIQKSTTDGLPEKEEDINNKHAQLDENQPEGNSFPKNPALLSPKEPNTSINEPKATLETNAGSEDNKPASTPIESSGRSSHDDKELCETIDIPKPSVKPPVRNLVAKASYAPSISSEPTAIDVLKTRIKAEEIADREKKTVPGSTLRDSNSSADYNMRTIPGETNSPDDCDKRTVPGETNLSADCDKRTVRGETNSPADCDKRPVRGDITLGSNSPKATAKQAHSVEETTLKRSTEAGESETTEKSKDRSNKEIVGEKEVKIVNENKTKVRKPKRSSRHAEISPAALPSTSKLVEERLMEWFTVDSLCFLYGEQKTREMLGQLGRDLEQSFKPLDSATWDPEKHERFVNICKRLNLLDLEDRNYDEKVLNEEKNTVKRPLPDYNKLKEEAEKMDLRVQAFYKGQLEIEPRKVTFSEDTKEESEDSRELPVLPLVHQHEQRALRRRLVLDSLNRVLPDLLRTIGVQSSHVNSALRGLVGTFALTASNVTLNPRQWTLVAIAVIKLLSVREVRLHHALASEASQKYLTLIQMSYNLGPTFLDLLMDRLVSAAITPLRPAETG